MTWNSRSTSGSTSSKSSSMFDLDDTAKKDILVYRYRSGCKSLEVTTEHDLCVALDKDPNLENLRVTKKPIPRGNSRLDVFTEDLLTPQDIEKYGDKPTLKSSLANVGLPSTAYWKRLLFNSFPELYIISKPVSPSSSSHSSPESSQHVSPATTFPRDNAHPLQDPQAS